VVDRHVTYPSIFDPSMRSMIVLGGHYPGPVLSQPPWVLDRHHHVAAVFLRALLADDLTTAHPTAREPSHEQWCSVGRVGG